MGKFVNDFQMFLFFGLGSGDSHFKQWTKVKIHPTPEKCNSIEHDYMFLGTFTQNRPGKN